MTKRGIFGMRRFTGLGPLVKDDIHEFIHIIDKLCDKYDVTCIYSNEPLPDTLIGIYTDIKDAVIIIYPPDLKESVAVIRPEIELEDKLEEIIEHEAHHVRVIKYLNEKYPDINLTLTEYGIMQEFYVQKISPEPADYVNRVVSRLLATTATEQGRYNLMMKIKNTPLFAAGIAMWFTENQIKEVFDAEYPRTKDLLLGLKEVYENVETKNDIVDKAKEVIKLVGW